VARQNTTTHRRLRARVQRLAAASLVLLPLLAALLALPGRASLAQASTPPTPTATPVPPGTRPDACEPNDSLVAPCALQTEVDLADLNFVDGTPDVYSFLFKGGRVYSISAASSTGIDPAIRVFLAGQTDKPLAENDDATAGSPNATVQVAVAADGWYIVEVTIRAPGDMRGKTYTLAARSSAAQASPAPPPQQGAPGDMLENNYDVDHAVRIAWGVPYDLSLECPDPRPGACVAGDHDFLRLPIKRGIPLVAITYDLGPGADTVLTLYRPDAAQMSGAAGGIPGWSAVSGNDDIAPGRGLRSQVLITPNWEGEALLVVAESERANPPRVPEALGPSGRYRLIVGSPGMAALQEVLNAQADLAPTAAPAPARRTADTDAVPRQSTQPPAQPTPLPATPAPAAAPTSVAAPAPGSATADAEEIIKETCTMGQAVVSRAEAGFYSAANPLSERRLLTTYPKDTRVALLGSCYIGWVKAQPEGSVTPGWMFAPDLLLVEGVPATLATPDASKPASANAPAAGQVAPSATPAAAATVRVARVALAPPPAPTPQQRQALAITVRVLDRAGRSLAGVKVNLVDAFGQPLIDAVTPASGQVTFTPDLAPNAAVSVQIPAAGLSAPVDPANPSLAIALPRGGA
jgi:hypothetical protein